jgi:glycogen debranching enzyme
VQASVPGLDQVLSPQGWAYASSAAVEPGDPGRFHALFGRDSLITALQVLPFRPDVAHATLRALAARQGRRDDPVTLEQPGRIGHEFRTAPPDSFVAAGWPRGGPFAYYATADATGWFLVVLDALVASTDDDGPGREFEPARRAASGWLVRALDEGEGLVRHSPGAAPGGLVQHGWRDAREPSSPRGVGILRPDGTVPEPPLADADTQAVTVAALRALGRLTGDRSWADRADRMRTLVTRTFLPDTLAVEAGGRPVPGAGSWLGWLLWADAVDPSAVEATAERLCRPDVLTPFGLRTLSSDAPRFAPDAYHRGSVWPFDSWLGWGGLRAAGRADDAERVRAGVVEAVDRLGRYPELYCVGTDHALHPSPAANRIQAWTVGARWALEHGWDGRAP